MRYVKIVLLAMLLMLCMWTGVFAKTTPTPTPNGDQHPVAPGIVLRDANLRKGPGTMYDRV